MWGGESAYYVWRRPRVKHGRGHNSHIENIRQSVRKKVFPFGTSDISTERLQNFRPIDFWGLLCILREFVAFRETIT
jgi:hypothetical protein